MKTSLLMLISGAALLHGCGTEQQPLSDTTPPGISYVILNSNPNPTVPLAAILSLSTCCRIAHCRNIAGILLNSSGKPPLRCLPNWMAMSYPPNSVGLWGDW